MLVFVDFLLEISLFVCIYMLCVLLIYLCIQKLWPSGSSVPMPPELLELYGLYQQELASRNEKEANYLTELNVMLRVRNRDLKCWSDNNWLVFLSSPPRCCHCGGQNLMTDLLTKMGNCLQSDKRRTPCSRGQTSETASTCGQRAGWVSRPRKGEA